MISDCLEINIYLGISINQLIYILFHYKIL